MKPLAAFILLALLPVGPCIADSPPALSPPAVHDDQFFNSLFSRLVDPDPATREAARNELDNLPLDDRPALGKLTTDSIPSDVKMIVVPRLQQMDDELAINPPPLFLDIRDANL